MLVFDHVTLRRRVGDSFIFLLSITGWSLVVCQSRIPKISNYKLSKYSLRLYSQLNQNGNIKNENSFWNSIKKYQNENWILSFFGLKLEIPTFFWRGMVVVGDPFFVIDKRVRECQFGTRTIFGYPLSPEVKKSTKSLPWVWMYSLIFSSEILSH